jgi:hypothetical protein
MGTIERPDTSLTSYQHTPCDILNDSEGPIQLVYVRVAIFNETLTRTFSIVCVVIFYNEYNHIRQHYLFVKT